MLLVGFVRFGFSVSSQKIGWEERRRYDLFCVERDIKPCSISLFILLHRSVGLPLLELECYRSVGFKSAILHRRQ